jgi:hypothetical protein
VNGPSKDVIFYRSLKSALEKTFDKTAETDLVNIFATDDGPRQQLIFRNGQGEELVVLNFSGNSPNLNIDGQSYFVQVIADHLALVNAHECTVQDIVDLIHRKIDPLLKRTSDDL